MPRSIVAPVLASLPLLVLAACAPAAGYPPGSVPMAPSHGPATAAEWSRSEEAATALVRQRGATEVAPAVRLAVTGFAAEHTFPVEGGHCYQVGMGWSFPSQSTISIGLTAAPGGPPPNASLAQVGENHAAGPAYAHEVCVDAPGTAHVNIHAITPQGAIAPRELLEYALVVGSRAEDAAAATARRERESKTADAAHAYYSANIAAAKARQAADRRQSCQVCDDDFRLCQLGRAANRHTPRRGVTVNASCEHQFMRCSQDIAMRAPGRDAAEAPAGVCGAPPR